MKKYLHLSVFALVAGAVLVSCEDSSINDSAAVVDLSKAKNGLTKSYDNTVVLLWNEAVSLAVDNKMPPPPEARVYAMVMLVMHDALNNVIPLFETYAFDNYGVSVQGITRHNIQEIADAAVSQAAHDVLTAVLPATAPSAAVLLDSVLSGIEDSDLKIQAIDKGHQAALAVLDARKNDFPLRFQAYTQGIEPGEYRSPGIYAVANPPVWPSNAAYAPDLDQIEPFGVLSSNQFRAIPPFELNSPEYTADYNEVKRLGGENSTERTPEQAEMGIFFLDNVANSINRVLRLLAVNQKLDGWETARLMALVHMAQFDAVQSSFEAKYYYNRWRPETAILAGESDGNDQTAGDASWIILRAARATPPTPTYPSTHAEAAGAVAEVLKQYFRRDNFSFTIGSYALPGVERSFTSFSQFAQEVALSRIYIGYHFRTDIARGEMAGRELGRFVFANNLRPL